METVSAFRVPLLASLVPHAIQAGIVAVNAPRVEIDASLANTLANFACQGERVAVILANNQLNVYTIGEAIEQQGGERESALQYIFILRAETCQQVHGCLKRLAAQPARFRILFLLGALEPFYDEDIRYPRAEWLLNDTLRYARILAERGMLVVMTITPPPTPSRNAFVELAHATSNQVITLETPRLLVPQQGRLEF